MSARELLELDTDGAYDGYTVMYLPVVVEWRGGRVVAHHGVCAKAGEADDLADRLNESTRTQCA
jgi:hypothetical protein